MRNRHVLLEKAKSPKSPAANPSKQAEKKREGTDPRVRGKDPIGIRIVEMRKQRPLFFPFSLFFIYFDMWALYIFSPLLIIRKNPRVQMATNLFYLFFLLFLFLFFRFLCMSCDSVAGRADVVCAHFAGLPTIVHFSCNNRKPLKIPFSLFFHRKTCPFLYFSSQKWCPPPHSPSIRPHVTRTIYWLC